VDSTHRLMSDSLTHELSAFLQIVLEAPTNTCSYEDLLGKSCLLYGKGKDMKIEVEGSTCLYPIFIGHVSISNSNSSTSNPEVKDIQVDKTASASSVQTLNSKSVENDDDSVNCETIPKFVKSKKFSKKKGTSNPKPPTAFKSKNGKGNLA
jgi:hypothetical protein